VAQKRTRWERLWAVETRVCSFCRSAAGNSPEPSQPKLWVQLPEISGTKDAGGRAGDGEVVEAAVVEGVPDPLRLVRYQSGKAARTPFLTRMPSLPGFQPAPATSWRRSVPLVNHSLSVGTGP